MGKRLLHIKKRLRGADEPRITDTGDNEFRAGENSAASTEDCDLPEKEDKRQSAAAEERRGFVKERERAVFAMCAALAVCSFIVIFLMNFSVGVLSEEGKIALLFTKRDAEEKAAEVTDVQPAGGSRTAYEVAVSAGDDGSRMRIAAEREGELSFQDIYLKLIDSVVCIEAAGPSTAVSASGIIMSSTGYIITNEHVVENAYTIRAILHSGEIFTAALVGKDALTDLAVLKIDKNDCVSAEFGDSEGIRVGDTVLAIGNPLGAALAGTLTDGIISAVNRDVEISGNTMSLIQTNAALNTGSSGGPLIDMYGQVIGINTIKTAAADSSVEGIGFAIPAQSAKPIIDELIAYGCVSGRPTFGFEALDYDLPVSASIFYGTPGGVIISSVDVRADAYEKGIRRGDVIVRASDENVYTVSELCRIRNKHKAGDEITLTIYRKGNYYQLSVLLMDEAELKD